MSGPGSRPFNPISIKTFFPPGNPGGPETYLIIRGSKIMIALLSKITVNVDIDINVMGMFHSAEGALDFPFSIPFSGTPFCAVAGNHNITATDSTGTILKCTATENRPIIEAEISFQAICIGPK